MKNKEEICLKCIYWDGDGEAMEGECTIDEDTGYLRTGRHESCCEFLAREVTCPQ